jgi:TatD DNase family protein
MRRGCGSLRTMAEAPPCVPGLVDAHCHLDYPPMSDDVEATLQAARRAGVVQLVHVGCSRGSLARAVDLARRHTEVFAAIGIHPHEASTVDEDTLDTIAALAEEPKVVAIGETGLDYHYDRSPRERQLAELARHVALARKLDMPLVLHVRDAHDDAMAVVAQEGPRNERPGMVHCFTGGPDEARGWLRLGFHLSFSGIATFRRSEAIREAAQLCPADRILLETDAPYLAPEPVRGRKNAPANVAFTCARLAAARNETPQTLAHQSARNTRILLGLPDA